MVFEAIAGKAFDPISEYVKKIYKKSNLKERITDIKERYKRDVLGRLLKREEFDFGALCSYVDDNLFGSISGVFLSPHKSVRDNLRADVYRAAYSHARADTRRKQSQVDIFMKKVLKAVGNTLCGHQDQSTWLPYNTVVDEVFKKIDAWENDIKALIASQSEQMLQQHNSLLESIEYQHSFAKVANDMQLPPPVTSLFHFRNSKIGFYGREDETDYLDSFLDSESSVLFTAVTGPAGSGKSKFLYEYIKSLSDNPSWKALFIPQAGQLEAITALTEWRYPKNLLIAIDYAGEYATSIGQWLTSLKAGACPPKMRIILIEREGFRKSQGNPLVQDGEQTTPLWYEQLLSVHSNDDIKSMRYTTDSQTMFLELKALRDDDIKHILCDYAGANNKALPEKTQTEILEYCRNIEKLGEAGTNPRPLIALFVVDAWLHSEDYHKWNLQELLARIIERYSDHWKRVLCQNDSEVSSSLQKLLLYATATEGWTVSEELPSYLQDDLKTVQKFCGTAPKMHELFRNINEKITYDGVLSPLEPDLIGEFFVLNYLKGAFDRQEMVEAFCFDRNYLKFLFRCIVDYSEICELSMLFNNGLKGLLGKDLIVERPINYCLLLALIINRQSTAQAILTANKLTALMEIIQYADDENIALAYANSIAAFSEKQLPKDSSFAVDAIRVLAENPLYAHNQEIVLAYASCLLNRLLKEPHCQATVTVDKLRALAQDPRYAHNADIVVLYAIGLLQLCILQPTQEIDDTVGKLRALVQDPRYPHNEAIASAYVSSLSILSSFQPPQEAADSADKLRLIAQDPRYAHNERIAFEYANCLFMLSLFQPPEMAAAAAEKLRELDPKIISLLHNDLPTDSQKFLEQLISNTTGRDD